MNNDEEKKNKKEKKRAARSCSQEVLDIWNKDFKNDIWANWSYKDIFEKLKSKIPNNNLKLVSDQNTRPTPGSENPPFVIKLNDSSNEQVLPFGKVWPISSKTKYKGDEAISIGYNEDGKIEKFKQSTNKVPEHLPKFIYSLNQHLKTQHKKKIENLDKWDTSNISYFTAVFNDAKKFNHDISRWKTDSALSMVNMFSGAENFNQDISKWNTSNVTEMSGMFWDAKNFNQNLNFWNVKNVKSMDNMFSGAIKFNSDLDKWEPKSIKSVYGMFANSKFNKSLKSWESHLPKKLLNAQYFKRNAILDNNNLPETIINLINYFEDPKKSK
ncbi:DUF285 domain-containing protein [Mycoplasmopsis bovis]|nr:DUF285 domain-containing protein [Mycoplasmopsis bovis]